MKGSFVIVNYNRREELLITLSKTTELIKHNQSEYEIVLVDNASTDGSAEAVELHFPEVTLIKNEINTGAPAWNLGFEKAKGEYFIIIDDDSHVEAGLEEAIVHMDSHPEIGILALNVISGPYTSEMWKWKDGDETVGFIGCGAIFRRATYEKIGGYADWMFLYVNEWELGLRCIDAGYHVRYFANSRVVHRTSKLNRSNKRFTIFVTKHEMSIVYKYFSRKRAKYFTRIVLNRLKSIRKLEFKELWYNIIGMIQFLRMRRNLKYTPVSAEAQQIFADRFNITKTPAFEFIGRDIGRLLKKVSNGRP